jgi:hypothetical protein
LEEQDGKLARDRRLSGLAPDGADRAVGVELAHRREQVLDEGGEVLPALLIEHDAHSSELRVGVIKTARDRSGNASEKMVCSSRPSVWRRDPLEWGSRGDCYDWLLRATAT